MALTAGNIGFVQYNGDGTDNFAFVALVNIPAGEVINFTDNGWTGSALNANEGTIIWTAPAGGVPAGTVVTISTTPTASLGTVTEVGDLNFAGTGDQVLAYQGTAGSPIFIAALNNEGAGVFQAGASNTNETALPTGLSLGTSAVALNEIDNAIYSGITTGTATAIQAALFFNNNFVGDDATNQTFAGTFTIGTGGGGTPTVNLSVSTNTGSEAASTQITVTATASSAVASNQTVSLAVTGTGITPGDFNLNRTTITIPTGQTTGTATFVVSDDAIPEGAETATITISNPSSGITLGATTTQNIAITNNANSFLTFLGRATSTNGAEIPAFDGSSDRLYVVAGTVVESYTVGANGVPTLNGTLPFGFTAPTGTDVLPNSVAVSNGIVAVAYAIVDSTTDAQQLGRVSFYNAADGTFLNSVPVGFLPDQVSFTPDGSRLIVANEGEPNSYNQANSFDPEGSISIINLSGGVANATVQTATFAAFNSQIATLRSSGVRIFGPNATVAQDLEPEYIAVAPDGQTAFVTLQENNAIAVLNIATATVTQVLPLGAKNFNTTGNGIDPSDQDGGINIRNVPVFGLYQPDAIASFVSNGQTFYITANEGDTRDYPGFNEEVRVGNAAYNLDDATFPTETTLKQNTNLGRLTVTNATGDTDGDGDFDRIEASGARSFSILNSAGTIVFDSGDSVEQLSAARFPSLFNSNGDAGTFDTRSDNRGPEVEGVVTAVINNIPYAFVGSERTGDILVYDLTNPVNPFLVQYINTPEDLSVEGLTVVSAANSPTGAPLLITANEVSNTVAVFGINAPTITPISQIQGAGTTSPVVGQVRTIEGIVTGDFQNPFGTVTGTDGDLNGFYVIEEVADRDSNPATSEGIFIFDGNSPLVNVNPGDRVRVTGTVSEFFEETQLGTITNVTVVSPNAVPNVATLAQTVSFPLTNFIVNPDGGDGTGTSTFPTVIPDLEAFEGSLIQVTTPLSVTDTFGLGRFNAFTASEGGRLFQFTNSNLPSVSGFEDFNEDVARRTLTIDDGRLGENALPIVYPTPLDDPTTGITTDSAESIRAGATVTNLIGNVRFSRGNGGNGDETYRLQPIADPVFDNDTENPRPDVPNVGGELRVANFNVENFFTFPNGGAPANPLNQNRGANNVTEFNRQLQKIITVLEDLNADVVSLIEIENNGFGPGSAIATLVNALNTATGRTYAFVQPPNEELINTSAGLRVGDDAITVAVIYDTARVRVAPNTTIEVLTDRELLPLGFTEFANVDPTTGIDPEVDDRIFDGVDSGRNPIAVTFEQISDSAQFTVVSNHYKSKNGSNDLPAGSLNIDQLDGQASFNEARTRNSQALITWLGTNPTGAQDPDLLVLGDLNSYLREDPVRALETGGLTNLLTSSAFIEGSQAQPTSFVFDGLAGTLDYAFADPSLTGQVTGVSEYGINADEAEEIDYNTDFGRPATIFDGSVPFRSADHDPILLGLNLIGNGGTTRTVGAGTSVQGTGNSEELSGTAGRDTITGFDGNDQIAGFAGNDSIDGGTGNDFIFGGEGNDTLVGNTGNDTLVGGPGADTLTGSGGADVFLYQNINDAGDRISDFADGIDTLRISRSIASVLGTGVGNLNAIQQGSNTIVYVENGTPGLQTTEITLATLTNFPVRNFSAADVSFF